jgi:hypothetical protein
MATVTFTTATAQAAAYKPNQGITKIQTIVTSATFSNGDVYILNNIKLPHRAIVTEVAVRGSAPDGTYLFEIGTVGSGGTIDLFGSRTVSAGAVLALTQQTTGIPATISVSDDAVDRFQTLAIRVDGAATSGTTSVSLQFVVSYYNP